MLARVRVIFDYGLPWHTPNRPFAHSGTKSSFFNYSKFGRVPYYKTILACDRFLVDLGWLQGPATLQVPAEKLAKVESYSVE